MNLDELRSAQAKERRKDSLQHLRDSFYDDVAAYVADLRAARDRRAEQVAKPFSDDDVRRMSDEVETAEEVAEALYERRVGKVVKLASFAAADMPVDADGMTTEERQLFDDLVDRISENKSRVLDVLSGEASPAGDPGPVDPRTTEQADGPAPPEPAAADEEPVARSPDSEPRSPDSEPRSTADEAGALAGAMGGADETVDADKSGDDFDAIADADDANEPDDAVTDEIAALDGSPEDPTEADDGPTAVPPEPAPPGAPGVTEGDGGAAAPSDPSEEGGADPDAPDDADPSAAALDDDRATVRITRDVGAIFGVDEREYDLASEDVVTLPVENADPLVARDAAERLD
ncbi:hypothetical protein C461_10833 [Halorubrum aidingense JCM 13560]|uniref:Gins51 C-terminal domain-containing protein n=1 Tax=Halorubrum aidingense JCM 13560 TaxID=1230454 RepID=M0PCJ0_9EURY|nr:hypothetical protein [Halorubrum aidingense]EMA66530.1 hypothetical protein C461_10833 [Halorubrum aidingense JCM 13560]